ncbi:DUF551 domain-containing protein [Enterobacter roggenkampii]|uniref:DUF551 domain-containing protein n=1 Tax=Enterobacter roggenkampii TaxID=1812935 RepID=UPI00374E6DEB
MRTITKERVAGIANGEKCYTQDDVVELARIALASLEAEPVAYIIQDADARSRGEKGILRYFANISDEDINEYQITVTPLYTVPPAPVSVPDSATAIRACMEEFPESVHDIVEECAAIAESACRAAMLQGADRPQNEPQNIPENIPENIPATQFKPVADLYGLTSPTGGETSFTFDAVEARDFIDGGWSCQEYVELGRFQEAMLQNGNSPAQSDCCPEQNYIAPAQDGNSPVIPDGWVACSERMPESDDFVYIWPRPDFGVELHVAQHGKFDKRDAGWYAQVYEQNYGIEYYPIKVTHWMPLPSAPQQEA